MHETGTIRISNVFHSKINENFIPSEYKIKDEIKFEIDIEELVNNSWVPVEA